jgi:hypothetical protein
LLALCGSLAGLLVAIAAKPFLIALAPVNLPRLNRISLDNEHLASPLALQFYAVSSSA